VLSLIAVVASWLTRGTAPRPLDNPLANAQFTRFTDWEGTESGAELSPDGKFVAFLADRDGEFDVWLSQVGTGEFRNLTPNTAALRPLGRILRSFGFSGDGSEIWFSEAGDAGLPKMLVPMMGGPSRVFMGEGNNAPSWSPDGTRLVYFNNTPGDPLFLADRSGADARQILATDEKKVLHNHNPVWSPDGKWIYFVRGVEPTDDMDVWRVRSSGESLERLTEQHTDVNYLAPIDQRTLLYVAHADDQSGPWLWALDVERKLTRRVGSGLDQYTSVAASRSGRRVVATIANPASSLWTAPILDRQAREVDVKRHPVTTVRGLAPRFGGTSLFYLSSRGTGDGLWRFRDGAASEVWKGTNGALFEPPAVSRDGLRVAVVVRQKGKRRLAIMSADGTNARTLAASIDIQGEAGQATADWSPDGAWIVTGGRDAQGPGLFKVPVESGEPVRLVAGQAANPVWSPDGKLIVYSGGFFNGQVTLLGMRPDGQAVELPALRVRPGGYRFLPDGTGLVYMPLLRSLDFWLLDLTTRKTRQITSLDDQGLLATFDITPDGKQIVFDRTRTNSNIALIDLSDAEAAP
jgi:Tol biopolymer transport system component